MGSGLIGQCQYSSLECFFQLGLSIAYNDSMSHLNLSRLVIDNKEPGFSQIGGVWLPLNHILPLSLVWNDWMWHSGFAASVFSMMAYVASTLLIYKIIRLITQKSLPSIIGSVLFALNLNLLYLQTTALTEPLYLAFFIGSVYCILKWMVNEKTVYLPLIGLFGFLQVLTRYDGWFVVCFQMLIMGIYEYIYRRKGIRESLGKMLIIGHRYLQSSGILAVAGRDICRAPATARMSTVPTSC